MLLAVDHLLGGLGVAAAVALEPGVLGLAQPIGGEPDLGGGQILLEAVKLRRPRDRDVPRPPASSQASATWADEVLIARNGAPAVRLVAVTREHSPVRLGVLAGQIEVGDDFDEPLPEFDPYAE